jgi:putative transport protein
MTRLFISHSSQDHEVTSNPAILAYADKLAPTDRPDIGYAVIFPSATIIKIAAVQLLIALGR